jgi:hypothetical protein
LCTIKDIQWKNEERKEGKKGRSKEKKNRALKTYTSSLQYRNVNGGSYDICVQSKMQWKNEESKERGKVKTEKERRGKKKKKEGKKRKINKGKKEEEMKKLKLPPAISTAIFVQLIYNGKHE